MSGRDFNYDFGPEFGAAPEPPEPLLPGNATSFETAQSLTSARMLNTDTGVIERARRPFDVPDPLLPYLAAERSVHHYAGDAEAKRAAVEASFDDHLSYGTPDALEGEIETEAGAEIRIKEFFEERGLEWPDFVVEMTAELGELPPAFEPVVRATMRRKNVRDWPRFRVFYNQPPGNLYHGAATLFTTRVYSVPEPRGPNLFHGAASRALITQRTG